MTVELDVVIAPVLVDFWLENFKLQVEASSGNLRLETEGQSLEGPEPRAETHLSIRTTAKEASPS